MITRRALVFSLLCAACQSRVPEPEATKSVLLEPSASVAAEPAPLAPAPTVAVTGLKKEDSAPGSGPGWKAGGTVKGH